MVNVNRLPKLCLLVAVLLFTTATSTDVAQEQPKKESFVSRFFAKINELDTRSQEVSDIEKTDAYSREPPKYSVDWYLLPKPGSRAALRYVLPRHLAAKVPEDCNEPIDPLVEKDIRKYFIWYCFEWYLLPEPQSRAALRKALPSDLAAMVPQDYDDPIAPSLDNEIRKHFLLYVVEWYLLSKSENRAAILKLLPSDVAASVPKD